MIILSIQEQIVQYYVQMFIQIVRSVIEIIHVLYVLIENFSEKHVKIHVIIVLEKMGYVI